MTKKKAREIDPFGLRMQDELRQALEKSMELSGNKSLNTEICNRLQASLEAEKYLQDAAAGDPYAQVLAAIDTIKTANKVISQALLKIGVDRGEVKIEDEAGKYIINLTSTQKEILAQIENIAPEKQQAILQLLQKDI